MELFSCFRLRGYNITLLDILDTLKEQYIDCYIVLRRCIKMHGHTVVIGMLLTLHNDSLSAGICIQKGYDELQLKCHTIIHFPIKIPRIVFWTYSECQ